MKRLASITFLVITLLNFYGYELMISYMQSTAKSSFDKKLDQHSYDESQLVAIKTKLNLPYYSSSGEYERAYGSINLNGVNYQYVKRRVHNDTLELLCLPNQSMTKLQSIHNDLAKSMIDDPATTPKKNTPIKISLPNFFQPVKIFALPGLLQRKQAMSDHIYLICVGYSFQQWKPPLYCPPLSRSSQSI